MKKIIKAKPWKLAEKLNVFYLIFIFSLLFSSCFGAGQSSQNFIPSFGDEDKQLPYPEPIAYFEYVIQGKAELSDDQSSIRVKGKTLILATMIGASTKLQIQKNSEPQIYELITEVDGSFEIDLPANPDKATEFITLVTKNAANENTSEKLILFIDKLYGFWRGHLRLDWDQVDEQCIAEISNLQKLENDTRVFLYKPKNFDGNYWLHSLGLRHSFSLSSPIESLEMKIDTQGNLILDETQGFSSGIKIGCYEKLDFSLNGSLQPRIEVDGIYIDGQGEFQGKFTGEQCFSSCHLRGIWNFHKFLPAWIVDMKENGILYEIDRPKEKNVQVFYQMLFEDRLDQHAHQVISDGPLKRMIPIGEKSLLGISSKRAYLIFPELDKELSLFPKLSVSLDLSDSKENLILQEIVQVNPLYSLVTFHNPDLGTAGFFLFQPGIKALPQRIDLPEEYSQALSPIVMEEKIYLIASHFNYENLTGLPGENQPALLSYVLNENQAEANPEWIQPLKAKNPISLQVTPAQELWILDGSFSAASEETDHQLGGAFEIGLLNYLEEGPLENSRLFMPEWKSHQTEGGGILNPRFYGKVQYIPEYQKIFISGERYAYLVDTQGHQLPKTDGNIKDFVSAPPDRSLDSALLATYGGSYPVYFFEEYEGHQYLVEFSSWENNTGLIISLLEPVGFNNISSILNSRGLIYYPINFWDQRGAVTKLKDGYVVSVGNALYHFKIDILIQLKALLDQYTL